MKTQITWLLISFIILAVLGFMIVPFIDDWRYWGIGGLIVLYGICWGAAWKTK